MYLTVRANFGRRFTSSARRTHLSAVLFMAFLCLELQCGTHSHSTRARIVVGGHWETLFARNLWRVCDGASSGAFCAHAVRRDAVRVDNRAIEARGAEGVVGAEERESVSARELMLVSASTLPLAAHISSLDLWL